MAWTAATPQAEVQAARDTMITAEKAVQAYMNVNNPNRLAAANTAVTAALTALLALQDKTLGV